MKYRKLRIAWSVAWGIACLLAVALWVRSYGNWDNLTAPFPGSRWLAVRSLHGTLMVGSGPGRMVRWDWRNFGRTRREELAFHGQGASLRFKKQVEIFGFGIALYDYDWHIFVPHWFVALLLAAMAATPWFGWTTRFSLRTLLIATTLVAVGMGVVVWALR
jgi:hypothetical protein